MNFDSDDLIDKCPECKGNFHLVITDDLQRHNLNKKEGYRLLHCDECCTYFKEVWKFDRVVVLEDKK